MSSSLLLLLLTNPIARTWGSISCNLGYYTTEVLLLLTRTRRRRRRRWRGWDFDPVKKKKINSHAQGKSQRNWILQAIKRERLGDGWCERRDRKIMHAVGARGGTLASDAIVRLFGPKSEQNAKWEGGSPSVPATSPLCTHTYLLWTKLVVIIWTQVATARAPTTAFIFLRISSSRHDLDDPSHAEWLRQRVVAQIRTLEKINDL